MTQLAEAKSARLLYLYSRLVNGDILPKNELAQHFHVTQRSIQRDMEALRCFFADQHLEQGAFESTEALPPSVYRADWMQIQIVTDKGVNEGD